MDTLWYFFVAGAIGALISDILKDNSLELPKRIDGKLTLGFVGSMVIGGIAGYYIDGSIVTAFMGGFVGKAVIVSFVPKSPAELIKKKPTKPAKDETIKEMIKRVAEAHGVDPVLAVKVAQCESALNPNAVNVNKTGSKDRGLYQWNDHYHPEITDDMAFDPETATIKFCEAVSAGNIKWWNASRKCWQK